MRVELSVFSFVSAISLFILVPFSLKSRNLPFFFLVAWLLLCNIIQGVNTIVWANNVLPHAPVWCDLVTPFTLALRVALPATALCLCRNLEMISSSLDISYNHHRSKYFTPVFHSLMSILVPVVYLCLHLIVQHQRFTIVEDFGCEASIYTSMPAIVIIWLLPLLLCSFTLVYAALSIYNYRRRCACFSQRLHPRSTVTKDFFLRLVSVSIFITSIVVLVEIFDMASRLEEFGLRPWTSWASVHSWTGSQSIGIISAQDKSSEAARTRVRTAVEFWFVPLLSIVLVAIMGFIHDVRDTNMALFKSLRGSFFSRGSKSDFDLPIQQPWEHSIDVDSDSQGDHHLVSQWDDTVRSRRGFISLPIQAAKPKPKPIEIQEPNRPNSDHFDASFMAATLTYVGSPTGKEALGQQRDVVALVPLQDVHTKPLSPPFPVSPATTYPSLMPPPRAKRSRKHELDLTSQFPLPPDTQPRHSLNAPSSSSSLSPSPGPQRARSSTFGSIISHTYPPHSPSPVSPGRSKPLLSPRSIRLPLVPVGED